MTRKQAIHDRIIETAAFLFHERGIHNVSLDLVAQQAGIARRTLYNHFESKADMLLCIVEPMMRHILGDIDASLARATRNFDDALQFCLDIWSGFGRNFELVYNVEIAAIPELHKLHEKLISGFIALFSGVAFMSGSRLGSPEKTAELVFRTFPHVLATVCDRQDYPTLFRSIMNGMLFEK